MTGMNASDSPTFGVHVRRIFSEYLEMPGLRLTAAQAQRLSGLEADACANALCVLVESGFLRRTDAGQYVRLTDGSAVMPTLRMAKAELTDSVATVRVAVRR
jgi:hypothetical protein